MAQTSSEQMRAWTGPALFSFGFRPFFLFGSAWVAGAMCIWILALSGTITIPSRLDPVSWHAHAFLFGYLGAILAGFLLTAVPNWTGRLPIVGWKLAALFALWCMGRIAIFLSAHLPVGVAPILDLGFQVVLSGLILQEIIAGKNWHNLVVVALLAVFTLANAIFHLEAARGIVAAQGYGLRLGLGTAIMMIAVIGGRIIPSFTRNWLVTRDSPARPAPPMQRFDRATLLVSLPILASWVLAPSALATALGLLVFGVFHTARLTRWQGRHTFAEPLVWVLHVAYLFIPIGAFGLALDVLIGGNGSAAAQHAWMAGAIGAMTLAVMTRATLGHTGQDLHANAPTVAIYLCLFAAVGARWLSGRYPDLVTLSGVLWFAAFAGFVLVYGSSLARPKTTKPS
ncbi:NnrS family protein [Flavimaricola marinus]|uniref:NnrS protein n=1 Tax=Flavimaricola marinus TaxID=1819565 RepID=A0A238L9W1_9RHOB|nr:NnrS family protein [Flavimaricola marinus]SMY06372.1 NnrS protein [Flavimaricola marinus]